MNRLAYMKEPTGLYVYMEESTDLHEGTDRPMKEPTGPYEGTDRPMKAPTGLCGGTDRPI